MQDMEQIQKDYGTVIKKLEEIHQAYKSNMEFFAVEKLAPGVYILTILHDRYMDALIELVEDKILLPEVNKFALEVKDSLAEIMLRLQKVNPDVKI